MSSPALGARELTRRLVARARPKGDGPDAAALAVQTACERAYRDMARWLGATGAHALLRRALAHEQADYPFLAEIRIGHRSDPVLDGVSGVVQVHGAPAVAAGLEAVLATLVGLLGRLIGDDMAAQLVEPSTTNETQVDGDVK